jgi:hypothetical protein
LIDPLLLLPPKNTFVSSTDLSNKIESPNMPSKLYQTTLNTNPIEVLNLKSSPFDEIKYHVTQPKTSFSHSGNADNSIENSQTIPQVDLQNTVNKTVTEFVNPKANVTSTEVKPVTGTTAAKPTPITLEHQNMHSTPDHPTTNSHQSTASIPQPTISAVSIPSISITRPKTPVKQSTKLTQTTEILSKNNTKEITKENDERVEGENGGEIEVKEGVVSRVVPLEGLDVERKDGEDEKQIIRFREVAELTSEGQHENSQKISDVKIEAGRKDTPRNNLLAEQYGQLLTAFEKVSGELRLVRDEISKGKTITAAEEAIVQNVRKERLLALSMLLRGLFGSKRQYHLTIGFRWLKNLSSERRRLVRSVLEKLYKGWMHKVVEAFALIVSIRPEASPPSSMLDHLLPPSSSMMAVDPSENEAILPQVHEGILLPTLLTTHFNDLPPISPKSSQSNSLRKLALKYTMPTANSYRRHVLKFLGNAAAYLRRNYSRTLIEELKKLSQIVIANRKAQETIKAQQTVIKITQPPSSIDSPSVTPPKRPAGRELNLSTFSYKVQREEDEQQKILVGEEIEVLSEHMYKRREKTPGTSSRQLQTIRPNIGGAKFSIQKHSKSPPKTSTHQNISHYKSERLSRALQQLERVFKPVKAVSLYNIMLQNTRKQKLVVIMSRQIRMMMRLNFTRLSRVSKIIEKRTSRIVGPISVQKIQQPMISFLSPHGPSVSSKESYGLRTELCAADYELQVIGRMKKWRNLIKMAKILEGPFKRKAFAKISKTIRKSRR